MKVMLCVLLIGASLFLLVKERGLASYEVVPAQYLLNKNDKKIPFFEYADWRSKKVAFLPPGKNARIAYVGKKLGQWYYVSHNGGHIVTHISLVSLGHRIGRTVWSKEAIKVARRSLWVCILAFTMGCLYLMFRRKPAKAVTPVVIQGQRYTEEDVRSAREQGVRHGGKLAHKKLAAQQAQERRTLEEQRALSEQKKSQALSHQKQWLSDEFQKILDAQKADHKTTIADKLEVQKQLQAKYQQAKEYLSRLGIGDIEQGDKIRNKLKGYLFEVYIANYFSKQGYEILEWTSDKGVEEGLIVKANGNPDIYLRAPDGRCFAVECKYRSQWTKIFIEDNKDGVSWAKKGNLNSYHRFANEREVPVWVAIGVGGEPGKPGYIALDFLPFIQGNSTHPFKINTFTVLKEKLSSKRISAGDKILVAYIYKPFDKEKLRKYNNK